MQGVRGCSASDSLRSRSRSSSSTTTGRRLPLAVRRTGGSATSYSARNERPAPLALAVYGVLATVTVGIEIARGANPLEADSWLDLPLWSRHLVSVTAGALLAVLTVRATRAFVARWGWARMLHADLRPTVRHAGDGALLVLGIASGVAEELFFRGLLAPAIGLFLSSLAFGALHQLRGRTGWIWAAWAALMGFIFGALYLATGSLLGALLAHAAINVMNLRFLRDTDVEPQQRRPLGGLLGARATANTSADRP
jgi:uncharacterized protein